MKRFLAILLVIFLFLPGCQQAKPVPQDFMNVLSKGFSCRMSVEYSKNTYQVSFQNSSANNYKIAVEKPTSLSGFIFKSENSNFTISYNGLGFSIDEDSMPQSYFAQAIFGVFDSAANTKQITYKVFPNRIEMYGETTIGKYVIKMDKKTAKPVSISIPSILLTVQIRDFALNNQS